MKYIKAIWLTTILLTITITAQSDESLMNTETVKAARELYAALDNKNPSAYANLIADNFKDHNRSPFTPEDVKDKDAFLGNISALNSAFPDAVHELEMIENLSDGKIMIYWSFTGTHTGMFYGTPASGNSVKINGVDIFRFSDGKFVEQWHLEDIASLSAQISSSQK